MLSLDLLINAVVAGILLGGFYAAVSLGITISFGMLDIANIAQPAFILLGSYAAYILNQSYGIDPIVIGVFMMPIFYVLGMAVYELYYHAFESRGDQAIQGLAFFFGLLFVGEVSLVLVFGVDYRFVEASYIGPSLKWGILDLPLRMLIPFTFSLLMIGGLQLFLSRSFLGRAILAVSQDGQALQLMAASPKRIKRAAVGISIATCSLAGAFLIIIQPVEPSIGRDYIGRIFAICVLGGMTSIPGMLVASMLLGIIESIIATFYGPSWAPAVSFGFLLVALAVRPAGLMGR
ncbi:MAG TPA: branched-chain amino acid ABC transporter permease [Stellaceae bacterium]|nr:branched-chain amino acid ABC transporter permease [Stellaceae bacterium]